MSNFRILAGTYVINMDEIQAIEFCEKPREDGRYRIKILFKANEIQWFDVSKREYDNFAKKIMEDCLY